MDHWVMWVVPLALALASCAEPPAQPPPQPIPTASLTDNSEVTPAPGSPLPAADVRAPCKPDAGTDCDHQAESGEQETTAANGQRIEECNRLIEVINRVQGPLKSATGSDTKALRKLAATLDDVAKEVGAVQLTDAKLVRFQDDYATMARELATASRDTAVALETHNAELAKKAAEAMTGFGPRESTLVDNINVYCQQG